MAMKFVDFERNQLYKQRLVGKSGKPGLRRAQVTTSAGRHSAMRRLLKRMVRVWAACLLSRASETQVGQIHRTKLKSAFLRPTVHSKSQRRKWRAPLPGQIWRRTPGSTEQTPLEGSRLFHLQSTLPLRWGREDLNSPGPVEQCRT
jgi:hypothetical protein